MREKRAPQNREEQCPPMAGEWEHATTKQRQKWSDTWKHQSREPGGRIMEDRTLMQYSLMREGLIQIERYAGKAAGYEEKYGNYDLAAMHRRYASMAKKIRMGHPADDLFSSTALKPRLTETETETEQGHDHESDEIRK